MFSSSQQDAALDDRGALAHDREIKCPVHGYIPVSNLITSIIDTAQFQRLRYLKQLGTSYFVWPGASHNRFEHSLGVFHLASIMVNRLRKAQPALHISDRDVRCVEVAGLCHDLGHGPFSHVWDTHFIPTAMPGSAWKHEDASEMMLDALVAENGIALQPDELAFVKDLISGAARHTRAHDPPEKPFLFEIVANRRNGIDVDKFDYIARDTRAVSQGTTTDLIRLVKSARVIDNEICYSEKNATTVYGLFQERFKLHKTIYQHKTAKSIEYMIVDALVSADPHLKISARIYDPRQFTYLNDDIVNEVERSTAPELAGAREIIHRIRKRDLYRIIDKMYLPWENHELWRQCLTPARIVDAARGLDAPALQTPELRRVVAELREEHIIVDFSPIHHGMGDKFPLDNCKFYGKYNPDKAFPPRREEDISHLLPKEFGEVLIRVFTRDPRYFGVIQMAARALSATIPPRGPTTTTTPPPRCTTPEAAPVTPRPHTTASSSFVSATSVGSGSGDGAGDGDGPSAPQPQPTAATATPRPDFATGYHHHHHRAPCVLTTPLHNNYTTVAPDFTPVRAAAATHSRSRPRKRDAAEAAGAADDEDLEDTGSPVLKRRR